MPRAAARAALAAFAGYSLAASGCHAARVMAPPPPLRAASAASYAVDVEFAEPLDRASAADPSRFEIRLAGDTLPSVITTATLVDTLYGRVVQLVIPDWLGRDADTTDAEVTTRGVRTADGRSTGIRTLRFRTGLSYRAPLRSALFDARCSGCHGSASAGGGYRTDSYAGLLGGGADATPDLIAGDPNCLLVRKCKPRASMFELGGLSDLDYEMLKNWVESYQARP